MRRSRSTSRSKCLKPTERFNGDRIPPQLVRRSARREDYGGSTCALTGRSDYAFLVAGNTTRGAEKGMGVFGKEPDQGKGLT